MQSGAGFVFLEFIEDGEGRETMMAAGYGAGTHGSLREAEAEAEKAAVLLWMRRG